DPKTEDPDTFGLFPSFGPRIDASLLQHTVTIACAITRNQVVDIVSQVPADWSLTQTLSDKLVDAITARQEFLCARFADVVSPLIGPQGELALELEQEEPK